MNKNNHNYHSPVRSIFDKFSTKKDVSIVYGEPIQLENKTVLPVAKVSYCVGGGGGFSDESKEAPASGGEGGGGRFSITPLGLYEVTTQKTTFKPVINLSLVVSVSALLTAGIAWIAQKKK